MSYKVCYAANNLHFRVGFASANLLLRGNSGVTNLLFGGKLIPGETGMLRRKMYDRLPD